MGHKPWDLPWRRQEKRRDRQQWKAETQGDRPRRIHGLLCTCDMCQADPTAEELVEQFRVSTWRRWVRKLIGWYTDPWQGSNRRVGTVFWAYVAAMFGAYAIHAFWPFIALVGLFLAAIFVAGLVVLLNI